MQANAQQLKAIELNAYAFELAQVSVQIGYLKWRRDNGFPNEREPVLQNLENFQNEDALLVPHFRSKPKSLKEAQAEEHAADDALKFYTERKWPSCDVIVSNPPFLGDKLMRTEMGDDYVKELRRTYGDRIPGQSDLCCYWFEKARDSIEHQHCKRAGLLATQGIRGRANREVLKRIKQTGDIFFPKGWLDATLGEYQSEEAASQVRAYLNENTGLRRDLKNKLLQSTDMLFRAEKIVKKEVVNK